MFENGGAMDAGETVEEILGQQHYEQAENRGR